MRHAAHDHRVTRRPAGGDDRLLRRYALQRDPRDLEALVVRYRPLAYSLARRYGGAKRGTLEDAQQVACLGLVKALRGFEPSRGFSFSTYAVPTIAGELKRWHRETAWAAHVPRPLQERARAARTAAVALQRERGRVPTAHDVAEALERPDEEVVEAFSALDAMSAVPLERDGDDESPSVGARLGACDPGFELAEYRAVIEQAMCRLDDREMQVLRLRFAEELSHREIARRLGIPKTEATRTLNGAVARLTDAAVAA